jgi:pimeloyl-ACP methyl ester carboxylesterase
MIEEPLDLDGVERELVALSGPEMPRMGWGSHPCQGVYYRPAGARPKVAFIAAHYNIDFSEHYLADHLTRRGFGFLGWNTRFRGMEAFFLLDRALLDIGLGIRWLRENGVETVVLLGNSGGGSLIAAYQAQAQRPVIRPTFGMPLADGLDDLSSGDLYVSVAAHPGRPEVLTNWLDPALIEESDPIGVDPALDMYNEENGPPFSDEFVARYRATQRARNDRITAWAKEELERVQAAGHFDRLFTVHRTWADLRFLDGALDPSDRPTPACYLGDPRFANRGVLGIGMLNTLRSWLSMWSLSESQCNSEEHLAAISLPSLIVQPTMDTGVFPSDARAIHDGLAATDKQLVELPGDHYFRDVEGARAQVADLLAAWVTERTL